MKAMPYVWLIPRHLQAARDPLVDTPADLQWFAGCWPTRDEGVPAMTFLRSAPCCKSRPKIARYILTDLRSTGVLDQQA